MDQLQIIISEVVSKVYSPSMVFLASTLFGLLFVCAIIKALGSKKRPKLANGALQARNLLTRHEKAFYASLMEALPQHHIFPQVSLDVLIEPKAGLTNRQRIALRNRYAQKRPDFVVCEKETFSVIAIVELDDRTHNKKKDQERDAMISSVGYRVERFTDKDKPWIKAITERFAEPEPNQPKG